MTLRHRRRSHRVDTNRQRWIFAIFAAIAFLPPFWSSPGRISADTKSYLMIDPWALLRQTTQLWDSSTGLGTVTHQTIGYLFPMGSWWAAADLLGLADWVTQRLWWGTLVFTALCGAHRLAVTMSVSRRASTVTALAYGLSPYLFTYISRISAILLPWAVLPWMVIIMRRARDESTGWRQPARFALLVLVAGTVNATSIAYAVMGAVIWIIAEAGSFRTVWSPLWRSALLSVAVSTWWLTALVVQGRFGINMLEYTETYETIRSTALPSELLRGFGYWFSYGGDWLDPWVGATYGLLAQPWFLALGLSAATLSIVGLRHVAQSARRPAAVLVLCGLALSVGQASTGRWSGWGQSLGVLIDLGPGLVLRSTQRAVPVMALGLAFGLGAWVERRQHRSSNVRLIALLGVIGVQAAPWFIGGIATESITREDIPDYWLDASASLGSSTEFRVWETPGSDFASYRWGGTIDPILPGLTERPTVARELVPLGTAGASDLVSEVERRVAENTLAPAAIAPVARLLASDTVLARNDIEFERYGLARPDDVTERLDGAPEVTRVFSGPTMALDGFLIDEQTYAGVPGIGEVPLVATWNVDDPVSVLTQRVGEPVIVSGSAATLVALAESGLIEGTELLFDADSLASDDPLWRDASWFIIGDSNRLEDRRWYSIGNTLGATRAEGESTTDPSLHALDVVDEATRFTTSELEGGFSEVYATNYGSPAVLSGEDRPGHAVDGDPFTAWRGSALASTEGLAWWGALAEPAHPQWINVLQPTVGERDRWITEVALTLSHDGDEHQMEVILTEESRLGGGQRILLDGRAVDKVRIEVLADSVGPLPGYGNSPGVGFAEITLDGVGSSVEWITLPSDLTPGPAEGSRTTVVLERRRIDESTANRFDPEPTMLRRIDLAAETTFTMGGSWSTSAHGPSNYVLASSDSLVGVSPFWVSEFDPGEPWFEIVYETLPTVITINTAQGDIYSTPSSVVVRDGVGTEVVAAVGTDGSARFETTGLQAGRLRVAMQGLVEKTTVDRFADRRRVLPVAAVSVNPTPDVLTSEVWPDGTCLSGFLEVDGSDVPIQFDATSFHACAPLSLGAGRHEIRTTAGHLSGTNIDRVVLDTTGNSSTFDSRNLESNRTDTLVEARSESSATWLVFSESASKGWRASINGFDLGEYRLVNGYAMAWQLPSGVVGDIRIEWRPQRWVRWSLVISAIAVLIVVVLARRRAQVPSVRAHHVEQRVSTLVATVLMLFTLGPLALLAPAAARLQRRLQYLVFGVPIAAMWAWTSARQVRWDMPVDLWWPSSMSWAQPVVVVAVASFVWQVVCEPSLSTGVVHANEPEPSNEDVQNWLTDQ